MDSLSSGCCPEAKELVHPVFGVQVFPAGSLHRQKSFILRYNFQVHEAKINNFPSDFFRHISQVYAEKISRASMANFRCLMFATLNKE